MLSEKIIKNIQKYLFIDTFLNNLPKEILFNLLKYNPINIIKYLLKTNILINWRQLHYFLYHEKEIDEYYNFPINCSNEWANSIINWNSKKTNNKYFKIQNGKLFTCHKNYINPNLGSDLDSDSDNENKSENMNNFVIVYDTDGNEVKNIKHVVESSNNFAFVLLKNNNLMSWGNNTYNQLGLGDQKYCERFELIPNVKDVINVFCEHFYTIILLKNGTIMSCGWNRYGQLGFGDQKKRNKFELVPNVKDVINVFLKYSHIIILLKNGTIMSCGDNEDGQLGLGDCNNRNKFELVKDKVGKNVKNVVNVFCDRHNTIILLKNGTIMSCGDNKYGQLGLGDFKDRNKFELVKDEVGKNIKNVVNVFCGDFHTFLLLKNGTIMSCGDNYYGQLGLGDQDEVAKNRNKFELIPNVKNVVNVFCDYKMVLLSSGEKMKINKNRFFELVK